MFYEDNHLIILNKKNSDIVQGDKSGDKSLDNIIRDYIKDRDNKPGDLVNVKINTCTSATLIGKAV